MKKLLLITLLLFAFSVIKSQNVIVIQTKVCASKTYDKDLQSWSEWSEWSDTEGVLIRMYPNDSKITISNQFDDSFKLLEIISEKSGTDDDGDKWKETVFGFIDKDGKTGEIKLKKYASGIIHLYCYYINFCYVYEGNIIEF